MNEDPITAIIFLVLLVVVLMVVVTILTWFERLYEGIVNYLNNRTETKYGVRLYTGKMSWLMIMLYGFSFMYPIFSTKDGELNHQVKSMALWLDSRGMIWDTFLTPNSSDKEASQISEQDAELTLIASFGLFLILGIFVFFYIWLRTSFLQALIFLPVFHMLFLLGVVASIRPFIHGFCQGVHSAPNSRIPLGRSSYDTCRSCGCTYTNCYCSFPQ